MMKPSTDALEMQGGSAADPSPKAGPKVRLLTLADLDHRTSAARRAHDLIENIHTDLGGADRLGTGERQIAQRAALLGTMAEDVEARWLAGLPVDPNILCVLANAQRRLFETLGFKRRPRDVTPTSLQEYLAQNHEVPE
jgi:hypothetical protein